MTHPALRSSGFSRSTAFAIVLVTTFVSAYAWVGAQTAATKRLGIEDYTRWRTISGQRISGDGKWVTYRFAFANTAPDKAKPFLHLLNLETNQDVEVANGTGGVFSDDSQWIAYQIDPTGGGRGGRGRRGGGPGAAAQAAGAIGGAVQAPATQPGGQEGREEAEPPAEPRRVELRDLQTGAIKSWLNIQSFTFAANSSHLILRRRPPTPARGRGAAGAEGAAPAGGRGGGAAAPAGPRGVDVILHNLTTGRDQLLGSVGDISFNRSGDLLAYTVDGTVKDSNGLFVFDTNSGRINTLDNDAKVYNRLTWSDDGTALAVLKGLEVDKMRERGNLLLAYPVVQTAIEDAAAAPVILDPAQAAGLPIGWVISDRAALSWSADNQRVFFGMKEQVPAPESTPRKSTNEEANVDVWNSADERIQSRQMVRANADRNFTFRSAFDVSASKFITLADDTMRDLDIAQDGRWAVGRDTRGYIHDFNRPAADFYRVNTATGERTLMFKNQLTGAHTFGISPDGLHFLYWKDDKFQNYDLDTATTRTLGGRNSVSFVNMEFDHPGPKPSYGIAGYSSDGKSVIAQHRYDLWQFPLDGASPGNLTNGVGSKGEIRFRYVRTQPLDPPGGPGVRGTIDLDKPVTLSAYGDYTKKAGFYERGPDGSLTEIVYEDASFSNPVKARKADKFLFARQTFVEFPDLRVSGPDFKNATRISDANPQQAEYQWGRQILFDYENKDGVRLQGILALPDDYKAGEKRPMLVTFYEKNSQNLHRYTSPSYMTGMGSVPVQAVSQGYITMRPDIHFRTGSSHSDMLECVEAAVKKVIEMGYVDPKRIGLNGHSYGGEGAAFIGTRSKMFAAVGMGAGVTDLTTDFSQSWGWSYQVNSGSGSNGSNYYIYGQGRWGVSPWDDPELYRYESAMTHAKDAPSPFLIMHGTEDPTVDFSEGMNFYNALRYNGKSAIMLAYPGEGHGLRGMANRKDLTIRYFEFFDHYLKDAPAPKWMTDGVSFLKKSVK